MKSIKRGRNISGVEVSHISAHGFWLLIEDREYFLSFEQNPWFKDAKVADILNVRILHGRHLHWPALDVDLELAALDDPAGYPLIYR